MLIIAKKLPLLVNVNDTEVIQLNVPGICMWLDNQQKGRNFYKNIADHKDVAKIAMMLSSAVNSFRQEITNALQTYSSYHSLWDTDKEEICKVSNWDTQHFLL